MSIQTFRLGAIFVLISVALSMPSLAHEPPSGLLIHLPFEGDVNSRGSAHANGQVLSSHASGSGSSLAYASGYPGQAADFIGDKAILIPFDLHPALYPQMTVSMWIRLEKNFEGGYLFSTAAPSGAKLRLQSNSVTAHGPRVETQVREKMPIEEWVLVAGVWDFQAGSVAVYANGEMTAVGFDAGIPRDLHNPAFARPDLWIGTYDSRMGSTNTISGIRIDELRIYDRALSQQELFGMAIGPPIQEEPQLGDPPLPPEEEREPHATPPGIGSEPEPTPGRRDDSSDSAGSGTLPGEDPALDKLRRTQAPGTPPSDDAVRDAIGDDYDPGPTTDWEQVQEDARTPGVNDEELDRLRRSEAGTANPGGDRAADAVRDQLNRDDLPESTDFETRRQGLGHDSPEHSESVSGRGTPGVAGTLDVTPMEGGELYVRFKPGEGVLSAWSDNSNWSGDTEVVTMDLGSQGIHTIEWFEENDQPCKLVVYGYAPGTNQFGAPNTASFGRDLCRNAANERSRKAVSVARHKAVIFGLREGEAGWSPLSSTFSGGMKGIEVRAQILSANGTLSGDTVRESAKRANFGDWAEWALCPSDHAATGVKVKIRMADYSRPQIFDLALICREVED